MENMCFISSKMLVLKDNSVYKEDVGSGSKICRKITHDLLCLFIHIVIATHKKPILVGIQQSLET